VLGNWLSAVSIVALAFVGLLASDDACASEIRGTLSSVAQVANDSSETTVRPYLGVRLRSADLYKRNSRSIGFNLYGRWTDQNSSFADDCLKILSSYIDLRGFVLSSDIRLGRFYSFGPAGSATIDGIRLQRTFGHKNRARIAWGSRVSLERQGSIRPLSEAGVLSAEFSHAYSPSLDLKAGLFLGMDDHNLEDLRFGAQVGYRHKLLRSSGKLAFDPIARSLSDVRIRMSIRQKSWYFAASLRSREPSVRYQSVFSMIDSEPIREGRIEIRRKLIQKISIYTRLAQTWYGEDGVSRVQLGLTSSRFSVGWLTQDGRRGERNSVVGSANLDLTNRLNLAVSADMTRYRVQEESVELSDAYVGIASVLWRPTRDISLGGDLQFVRNAIAREEWTVLIRGTKRFSIGSKR